MSIRIRLVLVLTGALIMTGAMVACDQPTTTEIVQTQKAQNKIDNATATAEVVIAAGGNPDDFGLTRIGTGSVAELQQIEFSATATAEAEQGIFQQSVGSGGEVKQGAAFDVEVPDGPAESGVIVVGIIERGGEGVGFDPDIVKIIVGSTVKWENSRRSASSTASDPGQDETWDSGAFSQSTFAKEPGSFTHTFNILGCFTYVSLFSGDTGSGAICVVEE